MPVSENTYALTDLARVKMHGGISGTEYDTELVKLIDEVSARVQQYLGRSLLSRTWTHDGATLPRLDSQGGTRLYLPQYPVTAVSSLKIYPTLSALTEGYDEAFLVDKAAGIVRLVNGYAFYTGPQLVEITYTAGYEASGLSASEEWLWGADSASQALRLATTKQVVWSFRQKDREREGVASRSEAGSTTAYLTADWLPEVISELNLHKRSYV